MGGRDSVESARAVSPKPFSSGVGEITVEFRFRRHARERERKRKEGKDLSMYFFLLRVVALFLPLLIRYVGTYLHPNAPEKRIWES